MNQELTIEDHILNILKEGPQTIEELILFVHKNRSGVTRQGVYRTLRTMKQREIITIHSKTVSLSAIWINKMQNYFTLASHYYSQPRTDSNFLNLKEGEKVSYSFRSLLELDIFWSHALYLFLEVLKNNQPVYVYNPHDWAYFIRTESDRVLVEKSFSTNRQLFVAVGNSESLDKLVQRKFDGTQGQYFLLKESPGLKENYYVNIIDDYCIEGFLDKKISDELGIFYKTNTVIDDRALVLLEKIINKKSKNKLVISRNKKRTDKLKKLFNKYFYIKKAEL